MILKAVIKFVLEQGLPFLEKKLEEQKEAIHEFIKSHVPGEMFDGLVVMVADEALSLLLKLAKDYLDAHAGAELALDQAAEEIHAAFKAA